MKRPFGKILKKHRKTIVVLELWSDMSLNTIRDKDFWTANIRSCDKVLSAQILKFIKG